MKYNRNNPSERYSNLIEQYCQLHVNGETNLNIPPEQTFSGQSLLVQAERIKHIVNKTGAKTILDYGSGKGQQYESAIIQPPDETEKETVMDYWDVDSVHCYDPCYLPYNKLPTSQSDGVICTDVLEHCPEDDIPWIIDEIFSFAKLFVFANIACYPAKKHLPSGENAHCTIRPLEWWHDILKSTESRNQNILWEVWVQSIETNATDSQLIEKRISNFK